MASQISQDVLWAITKKNSAYLVKRNTNGGADFSRDPYNLRNLHAKKYEGSIAPTAISIQPASSGGVTLTLKKKNKANKPALETQTSTFGANKSSRKTYRAINNSTAKRGYRLDLRPWAIARASAVKKSQKPVKADPKKKDRSAKARKA